ncbi:hypothetical protein PR048_020311 [Dryococelus australis]|uniref:Uncharacterized protein n=1 Tax=Dryococelus australis TaxID=614101 RepID=A0ABQ9H611_9NEOP|nr:hypothetical protein PR048_020311 [Dryococelus australis]
MASETVFRTVNEVFEYLFSLKESDLNNSDEEYDWCQLPEEENEWVMDDEGIYNVSYWSATDIVEGRIVPTVMPRNIFREIKANFHAMDNSTINLNDRLAKIKLLYA